MSAKRLAYTKEEDDCIWNYVNVTNKSDGVWGKALWRKLVATGLLPGRTVDSLKEHYKKVVLPSVERALEGRTDVVWQSGRLANLADIEWEGSPVKVHSSASAKKTTTTTSAKKKKRSEQHEMPGGDDDMLLLAAMASSPVQFNVTVELPDSTPPLLPNTVDAPSPTRSSLLTEGAVRRVMRNMPCVRPLLQVLEVDGDRVRLSDGVHWLDAKMIGADVAQLVAGDIIEVSLTSMKIVNTRHITASDPQVKLSNQPIALAKKYTDGDSNNIHTINKPMHTNSKKTNYRNSNVEAVVNNSTNSKRNADIISDSSNSHEAARTTRLKKTTLFPPQQQQQQQQQGDFRKDDSELIAVKLEPTAKKRTTSDEAEEDNELELDAEVLAGEGKRARLEEPDVAAVPHEPNNDNMVGSLNPSLEVVVQEMTEKSGKSILLVYHALFVMSGRPQAALEYLLGASNVDDVPWSVEEDQAFIAPSTGSLDLAVLQNDERIGTRTRAEIMQRRHFFSSTK